MVDECKYTKDKTLSELLECPWFAFDSEGETYCGLPSGEECPFKKGRLDHNVA